MNVGGCLMIFVFFIIWFAKSSHLFAIQSSEFYLEQKAETLTSAQISVAIYELGKRSHNWAFLQSFADQLRQNRKKEIQSLPEPAKRSK